MHRLQDIRAFEDGPAVLRHAFEVDEDGTPTNLVGVRPLVGMVPMHEASSVGLYACACGQIFGSWEEAKDHVVWDEE
jgi:hypothetical protein